MPMKIIWTPDYLFLLVNVLSYKNNGIGICGDLIDANNKIPVFVASKL